MIRHILCLLMMMVVVVNSVIGAPIDATNDIPQSRKDKPKPSSSGTLDSLGGGHLLKADSADPETQNFRSLDLHVSYQDDIPQNMVLIAREAKQKPSSSGTLDPIGGGNILKIVDPDVEADISRSFESLFISKDDIPQNMVLLAREDKQNTSSSGTLDSIGGGNLVRIVDPDNDIPQNMVFVAREDKQRPSSSGTLDPIGGGNIVKIVDSDAEADISRSFESLFVSKDDIPQKTVLLAREDNQKPSSSSGTLDSIGGGNFLGRIVDPDVEADFFNSLEFLTENQDDIPQNMVLLAREDKQNTSSSGTLDPLGGGNLVRIVDPDVNTDVFSSLDSFFENQGRQNMMRLAREDKSSEKLHTLDRVGGGLFTGLADPYRGQVYRSFDHSHLADPLDQGSDVPRMLDSISASELLSSLDSADRMAVLSAVRRNHNKYPNKRMLDSVSGWAFGESKRNFDEIDNVGFTGFAKRSPHRARQLALAKKNFDEIDRAGFETYNKRDFDEIDRAGFETFEKRDRKE